jgi:hypothetical protein
MRRLTALPLIVLVATPTSPWPPSAAPAPGTNGRPRGHGHTVATAGGRHRTVVITAQY